MEARQTPVFINLLAIARYDHTPDYPIQFMTTGRLIYHNEDEAVLKYEERQQDEETGEITRADISLQLRKGRVTMERRGDYSNTMVFSKGQRYEGTYSTPYGDMDMAVFTREARCRIGENDGALHLKYQLDIQGTYASSNELHLEYKAGNESAKGQESI